VTFRAILAQITFKNLDMTHLDKSAIGRHTVFWTAYLVYFYLINLMGNPELSFLTVIYSFPFFLYIFYSVSYILKRFLSDHRWFHLLGSLVIVYGSCGVLLYWMTYGWSGSGLVYGRYLVAGRPFLWMQFIQVYLIMIGHFTFLAVLNFQYSNRLKASREKIEEMQLRLQEERLRKRYEYFTLAQQVPAHLLVNVFQSWEQQLKGTELPMKAQVADMYKLMHYFMVACLPEGPKLVSLDTEIEICRRFVAIQQKLSASPLYFKWEVVGNTQGACIPPTGLLTLVMNVFKHGTALHPEAPAKVRIDVAGERYNIVVSNMVTGPGNRLASHGLGLDNLRKRLEFIFRDGFRLNCGCTGGTYLAELTVNF